MESLCWQREWNKYRTNGDGEFSSWSYESQHSLRKSFILQIQELAEFFQRQLTFSLYFSSYGLWCWYCFLLGNVLNYFDRKVADIWPPSGSEWWKALHKLADNVQWVRGRKKTRGCCVWRKRASYWAKDLINMELHKRMQRDDCALREKIIIAGKVPCKVAIRLIHRNVNVIGL